MQIPIMVNEANQRFDRFLRKYFKPHKEIKLTDIYQRIRTGVIKVNNKKAKEHQKLIMGDIVTLDETKLSDISKSPAQTTSSKSTKKNNIDIEALKSQILYEDDHRVFWNKPSDIVIHAGNFHENDINLNEYLESYVYRSRKQEGKSIAKDSTFKPSFGFRLDKDTSGVIVGAKSYEALQYLNEIIRERKTEKQYLCIVQWSFPKHIICDKPIFKGLNAKFGRAQCFVNYEKGLPSKTEAWKIKTIEHEKLGEISLVKVKLYTGRMHQIRVHLSDAWYPIIWDIMYGNDKMNALAHKTTKINRQLLHSWRYGFDDPFGKKHLEVTAPIPSDFIKCFGLIDVQ